MLIRLSLLACCMLVFIIKNKVERKINVEYKVRANKNKIKIAKIKEGGEGTFRVFIYNLIQ